jgi:hypothetical protein
MLFIPTHDLIKRTVSWSKNTFFVVIKIGPFLDPPTKIEPPPATQTERLREWEGGCHYCCILAEGGWRLSPF